MALYPVMQDERPSLIALVNSAYRGDTARRGWTHEADLLVGQRTDPVSLQADLEAHPGAQILGWKAEPDGPILGCLWLEPAASGTFKLGMLTVRPDLQDKGVGRAMLEAAEAVAVAAGGTRMVLGVIDLREALIAWYQRRGFVLTGATEAFPYGEKQFGEPQRDDLRFAVMEKRLT